MRNELIIAFLLLIVVACAPIEQTPTGNVVSNESLEPDSGVSIPPEKETVLDTKPTEKPVETVKLENKEIDNKYYTVTAVEGELVQLRPKAIDPDGDTITFTYTSPFDNEGKWLTKVGDEGTYVVTVGATDGASTTTQKINVVVNRANRAPVINCRPVTVNEGEAIDLHKSCTVTDEDDKEVVVTYSGWMNNWRYQTTYGDAGTHIVTITASDKRNSSVLHTVIENVTVTVKKMNRAPAFSDKFPAKVSATENDVITLPKDMVSDPDKDKLSFTFSQPFSADGVWKTKIGDAGTYDIDVVANDGVTSTKKTVSVNVKVLVTPPVLKPIADITVNEGETIKLPIDAYDRTGAKLRVTVDGWMTSDSYTTKFGDAGNYTARVTVSNGQYNTSQVVHLTVIKVNRAPVFVSPA